MSLSAQIDADLTQALRDKDETTKNVLRSLKTSLKNAEIEKNQQELSADEEQQIIAREIKRRKEAILAYDQVGKSDLSETETAEMKVLQKYMPEQMSEEEITTKIIEVIEANQITQSTMGQAMGKLSAELKGKADMAVVSRLLQAELSKRG